MLDDVSIVTAYNTFLEAFNRADLDTCMAMLTDDVSVIVNDTKVASTREEFSAAAKAALERGWTGQHLLSASARDNVLAIIYENRFSDGSTTRGAGALLFNEDGKIAIVRSLNSSGSALTASN